MKVKITAYCEIPDDVLEEARETFVQEVIQASLESWYFDCPEESIQDFCVHSLKPIKRITKQNSKKGN